MQRRVNVGEWYDCELYVRIEDSFDYEDIPTKFQAQVFTPRESVSKDIMVGAVSHTEVIALKTSAFLDFKQNDKIKILDEEFLVDRVAYNLQSIYGLGARRFASDYVKKKSEKLIFLK